MNRHGFTLIEIMLVIALMAILTGAAALKLTETLRSATLDETCQRLVELDNLARSRASNGGTPTQLEFRLEAGKVFYHDATDSTARAQVTLGRYKLSSVATRDAWRSGAEVTIDCSDHGYTQSYCLALSDPSGQNKWICFTGLGGQVTVFDNEAKAQDFLQVAEAQTSHDSH